MTGSWLIPLPRKTILWSSRRSVYENSSRHLTSHCHRLSLSRCFATTTTTTGLTNDSLVKTSSASTSKTTTIAILRETYDKWERRAPLTPDNVRELVSQRNDVQVLVQPCSKRVFSDRDYQHAGAIITNDLSSADLVLGVKRPSEAFLTAVDNNQVSSPLLQDKTYMFFSHTIKGQQENMRLLQYCLDQRIQLFDYERMLQGPPTESSGKVVSTSTATAETTTKRSGKPKRLVSFGRFAGLAGAIDSFSVWGKRLLYAHNITTPFLTCPPAWMHESVQDAQDCVYRMGEQLFVQGPGIASPDGLPPIIAVTGKGGCVHSGAMEMLSLLPHEIVSVDELQSLQLPATMNQTPDTGYHYDKLWIVPVSMEDIFRRTDGSSFDRTDFEQHPAHYRSLFTKLVAPYANVIVNCVYWDPRFPRLLTKRQLRRLWEDRNTFNEQDLHPVCRLDLVTDISCDINGSMEFLDRTTTIEDPVYTYDPIQEREVGIGVGDDTNGIVVMGVDILPTEFAKDSSEHFGRAVLPVVAEIIGAREQQEADIKGVDTNLLSPGVAAACITTSSGKLTSTYRYLDALMKRAPMIEGATKSMSLSLEGHLFDSGLINQVVDVIEQMEAGLEFGKCEFPPHSAATTAKSLVLLNITARDDQTLTAIEERINLLVDVFQKAQASIYRVDAPGEPNTTGQAKVLGTKREKRVLLLGAGRVSASLVSYLGRSKDVKIVVASDDEKEAALVASKASNGTSVGLDILGDTHQLPGLVEESDVVVSLLPAPLHGRIAEECILHSTNLVTASYEGEDIQAMRERAEQAGIVILSEMGLDPGLDHLSAMKMIDDVKSRGGRVTFFASSCGGLPAPEAANNPLHYKFSWSPLGVIRACRNHARYRWEGHTLDVQGYELLGSAAPFIEAWPELHLECIPNRDSLKYENIYGIEGAETVFRGTLRYRGFAELFNVFLRMGLCESDLAKEETWNQVLESLRKNHGGFQSVRDYVEACSDESVETANLAMDAMEWLGILSDEAVTANESLRDNFCRVLEDKLRFEPTERDMIIMHHRIEASFEDGEEERHIASLQVFGDSSSSAMAKTVGYTAAAGAELLLDGTLRNERGLLLPTNEKIYVPVLDKVRREGIEFVESVSLCSAPLVEKA